MCQFSNIFAPADLLFVGERVLCKFIEIVCLIETSCKTDRLICLLMPPPPPPPPFSNKHFCNEHGVFVAVQDFADVCKSLVYEGRCYHYALWIAKKCVNKPLKVVIEINQEIKCCHNMDFAFVCQVCCFFPFF